MFKVMLVLILSTGPGGVPNVIEQEQASLRDCQIEMQRLMHLIDEKLLIELNCQRITEE